MLDTKKNNEKWLRIFERKVLKKIFGLVNENGIWLIGYNNELYSLFTDCDRPIVKYIKIARLLWAGHIIRMEDENPTKQLALLKPEGSRRIGRPKLRWMDGVEWRKIGVRTWRRRALDRDDWKKVLAAARAQTGL